MNVILIINDFTKEPNKEKKLPAYVIPNSNFTAQHIFLIGIPCKVLSKAPYKKTTVFLGKQRDEDFIDVVSLVTGIKYTIPEGWYRGFDTKEAAIKASYYKGNFPDNPNPINLLGAKYYPRDNSYISDFDGEWASLIDKPVTIKSLPFEDTIKEHRYRFILVEYEGKIYRTLFEEWALYPKK